MRHYFITFTLKDSDVQSDIVHSATDFESAANLKEFILFMRANKSRQFNLLSWKELND